MGACKYQAYAVVTTLAEVPAWFCVLPDPSLRNASIQKRGPPLPDARHVCFQPRRPDGTGQFAIITSGMVMQLLAGSRSCDLE